MAKEKLKKTSRKTRCAACDAIAASVNRLYSKSAPLLIGEALLLGIIALCMAFTPLVVLGTLVFILGCGLMLCGL